MKKQISIFITGVMLFLTGGCGDSDIMVLTPYGDAIIRDDGNTGTGTSTAGTGNTGSTAVQNTGTAGTASADRTDTATNVSSSADGGDFIRVGFAQVGSESGWRLAQTQSMKGTFTEENGYKFDFVDCNNDQKTQLDTIAGFIADGVDYIVLDPIVEDGYDKVLKDAQDANIPVIVVDRNINAAPSLYTCWVGSDFGKEGEDAASWLVDFLADSGRDSEEINILTILGSDGASATTGRTEGFEKIAAGQSGWKLLDAQSGDFTKTGGNAVMKAYLKNYDDIDVVVCQNDDEALGAIEAIKESGKTCGPAGDIIIVSFDATASGFQAMIDGDINVDVECNPLEGPFVSELIQKLEAGETVESVQYMEEGVFPAETAAEVFPDRAY